MHRFHFDTSPKADELMNYNFFSFCASADVPMSSDLNDEPVLVFREEGRFRRCRADVAF